MTPAPQPADAAGIRRRPTVALPRAARTRRWFSTAARVAVAFGRPVAARCPTAPADSAGAGGCPGPPRLEGWARVVVRAASSASALSRRFGLGAGAVIAGRLTLALYPRALSRLAEGRRIVLVSGTNGKTTTSHMIAAALRTAGAVAHNASGANMVDGAVAALVAEPDAPFAVLEVDELHLGRVAAAVEPTVVVLLNLSRDQLDRGGEVRSVAKSLRSALEDRAGTTVVANADDPMVVWATPPTARTVWVAAAGAWSGDAGTCPACGEALATGPVPSGDADGRGPTRWSCDCGLTRPVPSWRASAGTAQTPDGDIPIPLALPGSFNLGNAVMAMAAVGVLGIPPATAARAVSTIETVAGRYAIVQHGEHRLRLLLAKNAAGFAETLPLLEPVRPLLVAVNAHQADGLDTSWLWDVGFEDLGSRPVVASGERAADLGLRLSYAGIRHDTRADPMAGLALLPPGEVDVVANYTAFDRLVHRLLVAGR